MSELLLLKKEDCKSCYKCIRECALKSIRFSENRAQIVERECVYCGHCYVTCPQSAKEIRRDTDKAKALIASGRPVIVSLAPWAVWTACVRRFSNWALPMWRRLPGVPGSSRPNMSA